MKKLTQIYILCAILFLSILFVSCAGGDFCGCGGKYNVMEIKNGETVKIWTNTTDLAERSGSLEFKLEDGTKITLNNTSYKVQKVVEKNEK